MRTIKHTSFPDILAAYGGRGFKISADGAVSVDCGAFNVPLPECSAVIGSDRDVIGAQYDDNAQDDPAAGAGNELE